eukprot:TRINITY_DN157_c0_g1_i4.p2 TRINITY_DN157_c0_g1~~TRINITY_DN157_c0_g1_i4.p2  ORF type:complete len:135 (-),score=12.92 TRINITY_DN157_c0_g1_i4:326-730(-)
MVPREDLANTLTRDNVLSSVVVVVLVNDFKPLVNIVENNFELIASELEHHHSFVFPYPPCSQLPCSQLPCSQLAHHNFIALLLTPPFSSPLHLSPSHSTFSTSSLQTPHLSDGIGTENPDSDSTRNRSMALLSK